MMRFLSRSRDVPPGPNESFNYSDFCLLGHITVRGTKQ